MSKGEDKKDKKKADSKKSKRKIKLSEGTALKNQNKKKKKGKVAVWVKEDTIAYESELKFLQVELLKWQNHVKASGEKFLILFEGRDAAGKGGTIKRITEHLNSRGARVVALEKPSDVERTQWFFQRYVANLPAGGEIVLFDRSWYNRAMVEPVMGFCTDEENKRFLKDVPMFEHMLVKNGVRIFKFYFSVSKSVQLERFDSRKEDPLKQHKISPVDKLAQSLWDHYTVKKFQMLTETNRTVAPWVIIRSDIKKRARLNCIKSLLQNVEYEGKVADRFFQLDPEIVISGIDELKNMEENLMNNRDTLPG